MTDENLKKINYYLHQKEKLDNSNININNYQQSNLKLDSFFSSIQTSAKDKNIIYEIEETSPMISEINRNSKKKLSKLNYMNKREKKVGNEVKKFDYLYSPRTTFILEKEKEEKLYQDLAIGMDPLSIKIMKSYFKEKLGVLNEIEFICILKNNLMSWHPELPNREEILVKLLYRLFQDIDLNCNSEMSWEEFADYLISSSKIITKEKLNYDLRIYKYSKDTIDDIHYNDLITNTFYIEKYNLIGVVIENKSVINFYNAETFKRVKAFIDVKKMQRDIDQMQMKEFDLKAKEKLEKQREENKINLIMRQEQLLKSNIFTNKENISSYNLNKKERRVQTPEKLKEEIKKININLDFEKKKKEFNKKLTILTTCFVNDLDLLFVSSSNNKISAWKYINGNFMNVNQLEEESKERTNFSCAILDSILPQYTLDWEPIQRQLYSGQADGKILLWDIHKSKNLDYYTLDYKKAKEKQDEDNIKKNKNVKDKNINDKINLFNINSKNNRIDITKNDKQDLLFSTREKMLLNIKSDMVRDSVSCIKVLGKMQLLAAGYYNGSVILWDTLLHEYRKFYTDQNTGIYQIEYNINKNLIYTCGFAHDIYIYDPFIDEHCIKKLSGHNWSINSISCNIFLNELISIDINGNIKIWDLNNYYNFQSININDTAHLLKDQSSKNINNTNNNQIDLSKRISSNQKMIFLDKANKIFTYGEKLMVFSKENYIFPELCDNQAILGCFYNPRLYLFYTVSLTKVKIWNLFNGKLHKIYEELLSNKLSEFTSFCTDKIINKLYLGNNFGNIICINLNYGNIIKEFSSHDEEIINLCHSTKDGLLISLSIDNVIKIHRDKELDDNSVIKKLILENIDITNINLSDEYSRLIISTKQGDIKYYDIALQKHDSSTRNSDYKKFYKNDAIINTFIFEEYPICLACHESSKNIFEIIPPHPYKFHYFGAFINKFKKIGSEDIFLSKIISFAFYKKNYKIFFGDNIGYVHCYSIKKLLELFDNGNILNSNSSNENINKNDTSKIKEEILDILSNFHIEYLYCFQTNKEPVKHLLFINLTPNIIISTGNDRKVKLFSEDGNYIDEFKQSTEKVKEIPIGIRYYYSDPFKSKRNKNEVQKTGCVFRKDLDNFKISKIRNNLNQMKSENKGILEYSNKVTEFNAQERLYLLTKNCKLPKNRSTSWNYLPNLDLILKEEKEKMLKNFEKIKIMEKDNRAFSSYEPIYNKNYKSESIKEIDEEKIKEFGELLNNKIRKVKLAISKFRVESVKYKSFENEKKRAFNINYKNEMKLIYGKEKLKRFISPNLKLYNKEREITFGLNKKQFNNVEQRFENCKENFNRSIFELKNVMEYKLNKNFNFNNDKDFNNEESEKFNSFNYINLDKFKKIKKILLPSLNNTPLRKTITSPIHNNKVNKMIFSKNKRSQKNINIKRNNLLKI